MKSPEVRQIVLLAKTALAEAVSHPFDNVSAVLSLSLATLVLLSGLALASGLDRMYRSSGSESVAILLASSSLSELNSSISANELNAISSIKLGGEAAGRVATSPELFVVVNGRRRGETVPSNLTLRGIGPAGISMREAVKLHTGRWFRVGAREIVVGGAASKQYEGFALGQRVRLANSDWYVVGTFAAKGTVAESELWSDIASVRSQIKGDAFVQSVRFKLPHRVSVAEVRQQIANDPRLKVGVRSERAYYEGQSAEMVRLVRTIGVPVVLLMALGSVVTVYGTARNSMERRMKQYRTLYAIGMDVRTMQIGSAVESVLLAIAGAIVAAIAALVFLDGLSAANIGQAFTEAAFSYQVDGEALLVGGLAAVLLALVALIPASRLLRQDVLLPGD
jgi:putative ABC transport system permease protein